MVSKRSFPPTLLILLATSLFVATPQLAAQQGQEAQYFELLRADLKAQRVALLTEALQLTDQQGEVFWPIYREHQLEMDKLADRRLATIKEFAATYETMTPEVAKRLAEQSFKHREDRLKLLKNTYNRVEKELGPVIAGRFAQVEAAINTLIDVQISAELPLIK